MLPLAAANFGSVLLFLALYGAAAARKVPESLFPILLVVAFLAATGLWVRVEETRGSALPVLRRALRSLASLALSAILAPILVLMPLFWLFHALPASAGLDVLLNRTMFLLMIALVLTALVNVAGGLVGAWRLLRRRPWRPSSDEGTAP